MLADSKAPATRKQPAFRQEERTMTMTNGSPSTVIVPDLSYLVLPDGWRVIAGLGLPPRRHAHRPSVLKNAIGLGITLSLIAYTMLGAY